MIFLKTDFFEGTVILLCFSASQLSIGEQTNNRLIQGGESRDLFDYFVPIFEQNRYDNCSVLLKYSTNFYAVKCKYLVFVSRKRILKCVMLCAVFFYTTSGKD